MSFRVQGLDPDQFRHLFGASDASLARAGARRYVVDAEPGFPDRIAWMKALAAKDRAMLGLNAPPDGLFFVSAVYPPPSSRT